MIFPYSLQRTRKVRFCGIPLKNWNLKLETQGLGLRDAVVACILSVARRSDSANTACLHW